MSARLTALTPVLRPIERLTYAICGVDESKEQHWIGYAVGMLLFSLVGFLLLYALQRLQDVLTDFGEAHLLHRVLHVPPTALPVELSVPLSKRTRKRLHRDVGLAALSGLSAFLTIEIMCGLWIGTGWTDRSRAIAVSGRVGGVLQSAGDDQLGGAGPPFIERGLFAVFAS